MPERRLGSGAGGEVWAARDRASGELVALKILHEHASEAEVLALVREATALSAIEGLGMPRVHRFGRLAGARPYLVRELAQGSSLAELLERGAAPELLLSAVARAGDQLTTLHRSGLLHGDVKPANVVVAEDGRTTLVDLGLAAKLRVGGARARGLTPKYAAPELLAGGPLGVRTEVYALGVTLAEVLHVVEGKLGDRAAPLAGVASKATAPGADERFPSTDELVVALRRAAGLGSDVPVEAWPVADVGEVEQELVGRARALPLGGGLILTGPPGSGRTTLLRRAAWELGVLGEQVAWLESGVPGEVVELELAHASRRATSSDGASAPIVLVDDAHALPVPTLDRLRALRAEGGRLVVVAEAAASGVDLGSTLDVLVVPPLADRGERLVRASAPGLGELAVARVLALGEGRPGVLRSVLCRLAGKPVASVADVDELLQTTPRGERTTTIDEVLELLDRGHFEEAAERLGEVTDPSSPWLSIARGRVATNRGDAALAELELRAGEALAMRSKDPLVRGSWRLHLARALLRKGEHEGAAKQASDAERELAAARDDGGRRGRAVSVEAIATLGLAESFVGRHEDAAASLQRAVELGRALGDPRTSSLALGSLGFVLQRLDRLGDARAAYEEALACAEEAGDAGSVATTRLNLATIAKTTGDLAAAVTHLEGAADMGRRSGRVSTLRHALLNLANLDLYLGRVARARASLDVLVAASGELSPQLRAQLLALEAEHATRTGQAAEAHALCRACADAYVALGRGVDAAEALLEGVLAGLAGKEGAAASELAAELERAVELLGSSDAHRALLAFARGRLALAAGRDDAAKSAFEAAIDAARAHGQRDWISRGLEARASLDESRGALVRAARDREEALGVLEEIAGKLPADLREVFWSDPRRAALQRAWARPGSLQAVSDRGELPFERSSATAHARDERVQRILDINRAIAGEYHLPRLLEKITQHAIALSRAERGFVILRSGWARGGDDAGPDDARPGGALSVLASLEGGEAGDGQHARFSRSIADRVLDTGEPIVTAAAREDERLGAYGSVHQLMLQSVACVPIRARTGVPMGALYLETRQHPGAAAKRDGFTAELPTLLALADQVAIAIESARLVGENERRRQELEAANGELKKARARLEELLGQRTAQLHATRRDLRSARAVLRSHFGYGGLVGTSEVMRKLYAIIDRVRETDVPVLITGESGTGKEVVARAIHDASARAKKQFLGINCGAMPEHLLESELFGHVRGSFTGADRERAGLFREASEGTLLLDEIGETPPKMQASLLRVLQEKVVRPVGGARETPIATRVIASTHRDLPAMVAAGTFREDLWYRLNVIHVRVPPLRERPEDIPALIDHFLGIFAARYGRDRRSVGREALRALAAHPWPGNVRQLENVLLNAWVLSEEEELVLEDFDLPDTSLRGAGSAKAPAKPVSLRAHKESERDRILAALEACAWNRAAAAKNVGLPRRTFYRRLKEYGIQ